MKRVKNKTLSPERLREIIYYDSKEGLFFWKKNWKEAGYTENTHSGPRRVITIGGKRYRGARLAWLYVNGRWPSEILDHIDGISDHDAIRNLREATYTQNMYNRKKLSSNTSGYRGVHLLKDNKNKKWRAQIRINKKIVTLGHFESPAEAGEVYRRAAIKLHKEFAHQDLMKSEET